MFFEFLRATLVCKRENFSQREDVGYIRRALKGSSLIISKQEMIFALRDGLMSELSLNCSHLFGIFCIVFVGGEGAALAGSITEQLAFFS